MPTPAAGILPEGATVLRRGLLVLAMILGATSLLPAAADAAVARPIGSVWAAAQDTFAHRLTVRGWADDPASKSASIVVKIYVDGTYQHAVLANRPSPHFDKGYKVSGKHDFALTFTYVKTAGTVTVRTTGIHANGPRTTLSSRKVLHMAPTAGERIIAAARPYVGKVRYVEGGASPTTGFDCSGYTRYVYAKARVHLLPHNAEAQRRMRGMRIISSTSARPGDLVFYLSGGHAYHVAIYAGNHMQYAAATPRDGLRYQAIWSRAVQYGTDWH